MWNCNNYPCNYQYDCMDCFLQEVFEIEQEKLNLNTEKEKTDED